MKVALLIDYDNLTNLQKSSGILDIVSNSLMQLPSQPLSTRGTCEVRIYGGWYAEATLTNLAQQISVEIQNDFPVGFRLPTKAGNYLTLMTIAELALALVEEPAHLLFNTFRRKGKPANVRVLTPNEVGCVNENCSLLIAKKIFANGKCPASGCTVSRTDLIYRNEQKIVDTMLTCDLLYYAQREFDHVMLVSGDDDFIPPLRTALLRGSNIYRVHPTPSNHREPIHIAGAQLVELEL